jgi:DNA-binding MarR family transcriptional regulator
MTTTDDDRLANLLGAAATSIGDAITAASVAASGTDELSAVALVALLDFSPSGSVARLSQVLGVTHSGAVRLVDRLAGAGYVERRPGVDARSVTVTLTRPGRRAAMRVRSARRDALHELLASTSSAAKPDAVALLESVIAAATTRRLATRAAGDLPVGGALCRLCDFGACGRAAGRCPAQTAAARASA